MDFASIKEIDGLGRVLIPVDIRRFYGIEENSLIKVTDNQTEIITTRVDEKSKGIKTADRLGRIVIPMQIRKKFNINGKKKQKVALIPCEDGIHIRIEAELT